MLTLKHILIIFIFHIICICITNAGKGCVPLDTYSFDKVISKFDVSLIKFDTAYPYGPKHDAFEAVCEFAYSSPDLLIGEIQVKDYGEKDNDDVAKRFGVTSDNYPTLLLFKKGKEHAKFSYTDDKDFTADNLKRFIRSKSNIYIGLPGCQEKFDVLASKFIESKDEKTRKSLIADAEKLWDDAKGNIENKSAETYVKIMRKLIEKGDDFVKNEKSRVENILKGKLNKEKQNEMQERINILQSFHLKDEL